MNDPRAKAQRAGLDQQLVKAMQGGLTIPLDPVNSMFLPRKVHGVDDNGMSYLCRILPFKIYEKAILDAAIQGFRRRAGPITVATVPVDYKAEQIEMIIDQLFAAEEDPVGGKVAFREGVAVTQLGNKDDNVKLGDEWDFLAKAKMSALGVSSAFLEGDSNYNTLDSMLSTFLEKLRGVRALFTRKIVQEKIFRTLARQHGFTKRTQAELSHRLRISRKRDPKDSDLILPRIEWDKSLEPRADKDYWDMLTSLEEKGFPIQMRKWAQAAGYDIRESLSNQTSELNDRAKIYAYKKALVEQAEAMGFDGKGQYLGAGGGESGGGDLGGGDLGAFGGGGGEEAPALGGGEEPALGGGGGEESLPSLSTGGETATPASPPAGGAGGGAAGGGESAGPGGIGAGTANARFTLRQPKSRYRSGSIYAKPTDLDGLLAKIPIWDAGVVVGMPRRRVAQLLDEMTRKDPRERSGSAFYRWTRKEELSSLQADVVEYCAARVGIVEFPEMASDSISILTKMLVAQADKTGLTPELDAELDNLSAITEIDPIRTSIGADILTTHPLQDNQILTGLTK